jgi:para-nitrobenzyl esterase
MVAGQTIRLLALLSPILIASWADAQPAPLAGNSLVLKTEGGEVRGVDTGRLLAFKGIPYAASPIGVLRWALPQPAAPWSGVRDAASFGRQCPQVSRYGLTEASYDEDCLTINVTIPNAPHQGPRPVIVWIYGGAFVGGGSSLYPLDAMALAGDAVVVSFNYRLGVFGFLANPSFDRAIDGTFGLADQRAALGWVQRNIGGFGGDPAQVTVAGESAGAASICMHLVGPKQTSGLFARAIIQSAACVQHLRTREEADVVGEKVATLAGCRQGAAALDCLRAKPVKDLLEAASTVAGSDIMTYVPSVGTDTIPEQPQEALRSGRFLRVPIVNGGNRDELRLYVAYDIQAGHGVTPETYGAYLKAVYNDKAEQVLAQYPLTAFSSAPSALGTALTDFTPSNGLNYCGYLETARLATKYVPTYQYEFADRAAPDVTANPGFEMGAVHSAELPYQFPGFDNTSKLAGGPLAPASQKLAVTMMQYWTSFAKTGTPRAADAPEWPVYKAVTQAMRFDPGHIGLFDAAAEHNCSFWQKLYPERLGK